LTNVHQILIHKLKEHSRLSGDDVVEICSVSYSTKELKPNEDLIRQADDPSVSALVLSGLVARYHLLQNGGRQYPSFHMAGVCPTRNRFSSTRWIMPSAQLGRRWSQVCGTGNYSRYSIAGRQSDLRSGEKH
jgi:hypothetical protein